MSNLLYIIVERETRFELATSTLARLHSTTELFPLIEYLTVPFLCYCKDKKLYSKQLYPIKGPLLLRVKTAVYIQGL